MKRFTLFALTFIYALGLMIIARPIPAAASLPLDCGSSGTPDPLGLNCVEHTGLSKTDPRIVAGRIVKVALGLIGVIFTVLTVYAGFLWMTAGGNEDQVTKARTMITNSIIGLIVVLTSYTITNFVLRSICEAAATDGKPCY